MILNQIQQSSPWPRIVQPLRFTLWLHLETKSLHPPHLSRSLHLHQRPAEDFLILILVLILMPPWSPHNNHLIITTSNQTIVTLHSSYLTYIPPSPIIDLRSTQCVLDHLWSSPTNLWNLLQIAKFTQSASITTQWRPKRI